MSSMSASLVLGSLHPHTGFVVPQHFLEINEGNGLTLTLRPLQSTDPLVRTWVVPASDQLLFCVTAIIAVAGSLMPEHPLHAREYVDAGAVDAASLSPLVEAARAWRGLALVATLSDGSSLTLGDLLSLDQANVQVCREVYRRQWNEWSGAWEVLGIPESDSNLVAPLAPYGEVHQ